MKTALLTGASGFIGANLARRLLREGHEVHLLLRPEHATWRVEELRAHAAFHILDLLDAPRLESVMKQVKPDWIFHLAAHGAYSWQTDAALIMQTNAIATAHLLDAALKGDFEAFVHAGSSSEYGFQDHAPDEDERPVPNSHYAVAKASATMLCQMLAQKHQKRILTLRLYSVFGAFEEKKRLFPALILGGLSGKWPPLVNPKIARDYVWVEDVCDAFLLAAGNHAAPRDAIYNLGSGRQTTLKELVDVAASVFPGIALPQWNSMPNRGWDTETWVSNPAKIERELGWRPQHDLRTGFEHSVTWFRENARFYSD